jgi:hypothetical protein
VNLRSTNAHKKAPPELPGGALFLDAVDWADQQLPPLIAFSVQLAADPRSSPAPRTVLHAAAIRQPPINNIVVTLRTMVIPPREKAKRP